MSLESQRSILPHWDGEIYSRYAAPFYNAVTKITGWREHLALSALDGLQPGRLLDVGCGTGFVLSQAVERGFSAVGVDPSRGMLERAAELPNITSDMLFCAGASELPFDEAQFDVVIASGSLVHVEDISAAAREILRVSKAGATIRILDHVHPVKKNWLTPLAELFSQLSGDIIHDYPGHFSSGAKLIDRKTLGRGGYLQRLDFERVRT